MAAYNKYIGNSGRVQRVEHSAPVLRQNPRRWNPPPPPAPAKKEIIPPSPLSGLSGELGRIFGKLGSLSLETEDLLLILILYLMYRESGDQDFLIMLGAFMLL